MGKSLDFSYKTTMALVITSMQKSTSLYHVRSGLNVVSDHVEPSRSLDTSPHFPTTSPSRHNTKPQYHQNPSSHLCSTNSIKNNHIASYSKPIELSESPSPHHTAASSSIPLVKSHKRRFPYYLLSTRTEERGCNTITDKILAILRLQIARILSTIDINSGILF